MLNIFNSQVSIFPLSALGDILHKLSIFFTNTNNVSRFLIFLIAFVSLPSFAKFDSLSSVDTANEIKSSLGMAFISFDEDILSISKMPTINGSQFFEIGFESINEFNSVIFEVSSFLSNNSVAMKSSVTEPNSKKTSNKLPDVRRTVFTDDGYNFHWGLYLWWSFLGLMPVIFGGYSELRDPKLGSASAFQFPRINSAVIQLRSFCSKVIRRLFSKKKKDITRRSGVF